MGVSACLTRARSRLWLTTVDINGELATLGDAHDAGQVRRYISDTKTAVLIECLELENIEYLDTRLQWAKCGVH